MQRRTDPIFIPEARLAMLVRLARIGFDSDIWLHIMMLCLKGWVFIDRWVRYALQRMGLLCRAVLLRMQS